MIEKSPAERAVDADLACPRFRVGVTRKHWRILTYEFPDLVVAVAATEPDGSRSEYIFKFELMDYPAVAPQVVIWDVEANTALAAQKRPKGSPRLNMAFQSWGPPDTVYRPWERVSCAHGGWAQKYPDLAWHPNRDLTFALEDLHGLLTSNALAGSAGATA